MTTITRNTPLSHPDSTAYSPSQRAEIRWAEQYHLSCIRVRTGAGNGAYREAYLQDVRTLTDVPQRGEVTAVQIIWLHPCINYQTVQLYDLVHPDDLPMIEHHLHEKGLTLITGRPG